MSAYLGLEVRVVDDGYAYMGHLQSTHIIRTAYNTYTIHF